jgi:hypothetical protein
MGYFKNSKYIHCKYCEYYCIKYKKHFICDMLKCKRLDYNICLFNQPYCDKCLDIIKRFEEFLEKYGIEEFIQLP